MYFENSESVKSDIVKRWSEFAESNDPKGILDEWADSDLPIYYNDIIKQWAEMPSEYDNKWQELYGSEIGDKRITDLMLIDLYQYYTDAYYEIYEEVADEMETDESEAN